MTSNADAAPDKQARSTKALVDSFRGASLDRSLWRVWRGDVRVTPAGVVLASLPPTRLAETHSALLTTHRTWGNFAFDFSTTPLRQLRLNAPGNTWETSWVVFRFRDLANYYYFMVKPNGWELGKKHGVGRPDLPRHGRDPGPPYRRHREREARRPRCSDPGLGRRCPHPRLRRPEATPRRLGRPLSGRRQGQVRLRARRAGLKARTAVPERRRPFVGEAVAPP